MRKILLFLTLLIMPMSASAQGGGQFGGSGGGSGSGPSPIDLSAPPYNLQSANWVNDASSTNLSQTVTCSNNDCNFTSAAVGQKVYGICNVDGSNRCPPVGTILSLNNANSVQVSVAATITGTATTTLVWGPDSTSALTAATTAVNASVICPHVKFPAGYFLTSLPQFNGSTKCAPGVGFRGGNGSIGESSGIYFSGEGQYVSYLVPTPDFTFAGSVGQFFSNNGSAVNFSNIGVSGMGWSCTGKTTGSAIGITIPQNSSIDNVNLVSWCTKAADTFTGALVNGPGFSSRYFIVDGFGNSGVTIQSGCCNNMTGGWIDNIGTPGYALTVNNTAQLYTKGLQLGEGGVANTVKMQPGANWVSDSDNIGTSGVGTACIDMRSAGATLTTLFLRNALLGCNGGAQFGILIGTASGANVTINGSVLNGGTAGWLSGSAGTVNFLQGNRITAGTNQFTGTFNADGYTIRGACTGVATASQTLGLYGTGPNETLTTCTSLVIGSGIAAPRAGTLEFLYVTATAGGVNASSGVVTVLKNGGATTITCTVGTAVACQDLTHTVAFVAGDLISIQFTTQGGETLAGVNAFVTWN